MDSDDPGGSRENYYSLLDTDRKKRKFNLDNPYDFPTINKKKTKNNTTKTSSKQCPKFIVIKNTDPTKPIRSFNIFAVAKALEGITTEQPLSTTFTRMGDILILTKNPTQTLKYIRAKQLANICDINVSLHPTLNTCKGVIYAPSLTELSEAEIVDGLSDQNVVECQKITNYKDGQIKNTPLHIVSFNCYELPSEIDVAWQKIKVEPYFPKPMQCKNCHIIGHTRNHCKNEKKCIVCSSSEHEGNCIKVECINCKKEHCSNNKNCPTLKKRQEILKIKTIEKCAYREAIQIVNQNRIDYNLNSPTDTLEEAIQIKNKIKEKQKKINEEKIISDNITEMQHSQLPTTSHNIQSLPKKISQNTKKTEIINNTTISQTSLSTLSSPNPSDKNENVDLLIKKYSSRSRSKMDTS